jgi:hypothetical protein
MDIIYALRILSREGRGCSHSIASMSCNDLLVSLRATTRYISPDSVVKNGDVEIENYIRSTGAIRTSNYQNDPFSH